MLTAKNICKSYGGKKIIDGLDITLTPGKTTCLIGPSGGGKTTLLKCLSLVEHPDSGQIEIDGKSHDFPLNKAKNAPAPWPGLTVVFQSLFLWPHMSLRENILLPGRNINSDVEKDLTGLIAVFEMADFIDRYPNEVSGGQRQRAALVRALILNPRYLLLDEITSALDVEQTAKILTKLTHLKDREIGTLLITHHLNFARRAADHIVFMAAGKIVEQGSPALLDAPRSQRFQGFLDLARLAV